MIRLWSSPVAALAALGVAMVPTAAPDRTPPRIVTAVMVDLNGNARAERVRLTYSERIRHARDNDGKYSFVVVGYRVLAVGAASGRSLVLLVKEGVSADSAARPVVRYRKTSSKPVLDGAGNQASAQVFRLTRAHGHVPPVQPKPAPAPAPAPAPSPAPAPAPAPVAKDSDADGFDDAHDCAPTNASIHPGAPDVPDLGFVDSNCDGIDGTEANAVFASPTGSDADPGTKSQPKRQIQAAVLEAANTGKDVFAAAGAFDRINAETGVAVYGGYDPTTWRRSTELTTTITGAPEGVLLDGDKNVLLQFVTVSGTGGSGPNVYGFRAINGSGLSLQRVTVTAAGALVGSAGPGGANGASGGQGQDGRAGKCDDSIPSGAVAGGSSPAGRVGGNGGEGGNTDIFSGKRDGQPGGPSADGTAGGAGGTNGNPGKPGQNGQSGANGASGSPGAGGATPTAGVTWFGQNGSGGASGQPGHGGGGGGGGGGQDGLFVSNGAGNGGGGGGGGGAGGGGGLGGGWGGGSFGVYLYNSTFTSDSSSITAGNGGAGGPGGAGGLGGFPGAGGLGGTTCTSEVGAGGNGGNGGLGGHGGGGGGGSGGPSVGIFKAGTSTATVTGSTVLHSAAGGGGIGGGISPFQGANGGPGIAAEIYSL